MCVSLVCYTATIYDEVEVVHITKNVTNTLFNEVGVVLLVEGTRVIDDNLHNVRERIVATNLRSGRIVNMDKLNGLSGRRNLSVSSADTANPNLVPRPVKFLVLVL